MKDDMLIDAGWSAQELALIGSAEQDSPPDGAVERTLAALGVGAVVGASGAALGTAASTGKVGGAWVKWLLTSALVGGAAVGALTLAFSSPKPTAVVPIRTQAPASVVVVPSSAPPETPGSQAAEAPSAVRPYAPPASTRPLTAAPRASGERAAKATLSEEIRAIDEARGLLRAGDPSGALAALARYDALVKGRGSMTAEATVVRIEALRGSGDDAGALALGQRFLMHNPRSPYAEHVRRMLK